MIEWNEPISLKKKRTQITKPGLAGKQLVKTPSAALDGQPPTPSSLSPTPRPDSSTASRHYADEAQAPHSTHVTATPPQHPHCLVFLPRRAEGAALNWDQAD